MELYKKYLQYLVEWAQTHAEPGFIGMSPVCFDEWLACEGQVAPESRLPECDSDYCIYNPNGYCCVPLVYAKQPELTEDGCKSFIYRE